MSIAYHISLMYNKKGTAWNYKDRLTSKSWSCRWSTDVVSNWALPYRRRRWAGLRRGPHARPARPALATRLRTLAILRSPPVLHACSNRTIPRWSLWWFYHYLLHEIHITKERLSVQTFSTLTTWKPFNTLIFRRNEKYVPVILA